MDKLLSGILAQISTEPALQIASSIPPEWMFLIMAFAVVMVILYIRTKYLLRETDQALEQTCDKYEKVQTMLWAVLCPKSLNFERPAMHIRAELARTISFLETNCVTEAKEVLDNLGYTLNYLTKGKADRKKLSLIHEAIDWVFKISIEDDIPGAIEGLQHSMAQLAEIKMEEDKLENS